MLAAMITFVCFLTFTKATAQTSETTSAPSTESPFKVTADLVSSYVWRGSLATPSPTPNIQPTLAYVKGSFELGVWGSTDFQGSYKEADLYASYTAGALKFTLTDYDWNFKNSLTGEPIRYFNYKSKETGHIFEGSVGYTGPQSFPLSVSANVMFAGADKKLSDATKQAFSTYVELGYAFSKFNAFLGCTPDAGMYSSASGFAVVNLGISATRNLKISDKFELPLKTTFVVNPQKEDVHLVFGITF